MTGVHRDEAREEIWCPCLLLNGGAASLCDDGVKRGGLWVGWTYSGGDGAAGFLSPGSLGACGNLQQQLAGDPGCRSPVPLLRDGDGSWKEKRVGHPTQFLASKYG